MYKYILKNYKRKINILLLFKVFLRIKDYFFQNKNTSYLFNKQTLILIIILMEYNKINIFSFLH